MEKTVLINCSPKQKLSVSGFLMKCAGVLIRGKKEYFHLRTPADYPAILQALKGAGKVVFVTPLYVDSIPSHMLPFMQEMEELCRGNGLRLKVYVIANNGFIEGKQNEPLMQVMENFCARSGLTWCGGIGIGGGVMLNVERIMITVMFGLMLLNVLLSAVQGGDVLDPVLSFGKSRVRHPSGGSHQQGDRRREKVYEDYAAILCLYCLCRYLLHHRLRASGRHFPRVAFKVPTGCGL